MSAPSHPKFLEGTNIEVLSALSGSLQGHAYMRITYKQTPSDWPLKQMMKKYRIHGKAAIPLSPDEMVDMRVVVDNNRQRSVKYTMQYRHLGKNLKIRTDSAHDRPHIDVEIGTRRLPKIWLKSKPSDYEASINTVLRVAEKYSNPLIGAAYWLYPSGIYSSHLLDLFPKYKTELSVATPLTDIARFASLEILRLSLAGKKFTPDDYAEIIKEEFGRCVDSEKKNGGLPLEATEITLSRDIAPLPFPVMAPPGASSRMEAYDLNGNLMRNVGPVAMEYKLG